MRLPLVLVIVAYLGVLIYCITKGSVLVTNPNRAGFLALAQLPVVFLFATKNSVLFVSLQVIRYQLLSVTRVNFAFGGPSE